MALYSRVFVRQTKGLQVRENIAVFGKNAYRISVRTRPLTSVRR